MDKIECQATGEVTTVVEDVLVIGVGNYDSVTKKECITQLEILINVKDGTNKTQSKPSVNAEDDANNMRLDPLVNPKDDANNTQLEPSVNTEDDTDNTPLEPPWVDVNDDANKNLVFTITSRNVNL